jgi:hypothetical protein
VGYDEMSEAEQHAAVMAMWRELMAQLGENPDKLVGENVQDDPPDEPGL